MRNKIEKVFTGDKTTKKVGERRPKRQFMSAAKENTKEE